MPPGFGPSILTALADPLKSKPVQLANRPLSGLNALNSEQVSIIYCVPQLPRTGVGGRPQASYRCCLLEVMLQRGLMLERFS